MTTANRLRHFTALRLLVLILTLTGVVPGVAQTTGHPLLLEGRETVYQRVLTRPGAALHAAPDGALQDRYPAFQPLYVWARQPGWVQVGPSVSQAPVGWMPAGDVVLWRQNIVGAFTNPAGRQRSIFFRTQEKLEWLLNQETIAQVQEDILSQADRGTSSPEFGVVAVEPPEFIDINQRLYLLPILDFKQGLHPRTYEPNLMLEVASVPLSLESSGTHGAMGQFDTGIVFVFDTTKSMGPFIASTQEAVEAIIRQIQGTEIGDRTNFGVVAFRDNPAASPGLEYRTKVLLPLQRRADQTPVIATIRAATQVAQVSSPGFNEDSLAGVEDAIDLTDWTASGGDAFDARVVILVTDAGPKEPTDVNARSAIGVDELRAEAERQNIVLMTLHLRTPAGGEGQHRYAQERYQALSRFSGNTYYYGIDGRSPDLLRREVTSLVTSLTDIVRVARGEAPTLPAEETSAALTELGLALRLAYLGNLQGTQAPSMFSGWVSEKAAEDPARLAITPRLLVTRNEMATMFDLLGELIALSGTGTTQEDSQRFFSQVRDVIARMAQNPDRLLNADATLENLGQSLEFLLDLPYESEVLRMTPQRWEASAMNRRSFIDGLRQKHEQYGKWLRNPSVWTPLFDGAPDGEHVFAMPFDTLP